HSTCSEAPARPTNSWKAYPGPVMGPPRKTSSWIGTGPAVTPARVVRVTNRSTPSGRSTDNTASARAKELTTPIALASRRISVLRGPGEVGRDTESDETVCQRETAGTVGEKWPDVGCACTANESWHSRRTPTRQSRPAMDGRETEAAKPRVSYGSVWSAPNSCAAKLLMSREPSGRSPTSR